MKLMFWILVAATVYGVMSYMTLSYSKAMEQCQVKHSFDTCFYSLNR